MRGVGYEQDDDRGQQCDHALPDEQRQDHVAEGVCDNSSPGEAGISGVYGAGSCFFPGGKGGNIGAYRKERRRKEHDAEDHLRDIKAHHRKRGLPWKCGADAGAWLRIRYGPNGKGEYLPQRSDLGVQRGISAGKVR